MIIRKFLQWSATAPAEARTQGAAALARALADGELDAAERREGEAALMSLLDDPAPTVRLAIALELADAATAPPTLVSALAGDRSDIAAPLLEFSPVLTTLDLVDAVALGDTRAQEAVARRCAIDVSLSAAIAEVAGAAACAILCANRTAAVSDAALARMLERFGHDAGLREALADRPDLPPGLRCDLVSATARSLAAFVSSCGWLPSDRAGRAAAEAVEEGRLIIAADTWTRQGGAGVVALVRHLRDSGCLTPALILRALVGHNLALFEAALSELSGMAPQRVAGLVRAGRGLGFRSLYEKAGLPPALRPVFQAGLDDGLAGPAAGNHEPERIGRMLAACATLDSPQFASVALLLRRLQASAARTQARAYARDVLAEAGPLRLPRLSATDRTLPTAA